MVANVPVKTNKKSNGKSGLKIFAHVVTSHAPRLNFKI